MKKIVIAALLLMVSACGGGASQSNKWNSLEIQNVSNGEVLSVKSVLNGRPTLLSLWSVTCTPCKRELPWLQKLSESNNTVQIVGVDIGDDVADIKEFASNLHLSISIYRDEMSDMLAALNVAQVPATFAIDSSGEIVWKHLGAVTYEDLTAQVAKLS